MHFDVKESLPQEVEGLNDAGATECVAACYRCLMSYFNQPDHESIDRHDEHARRILLRLARARTTVDLGRPRPRLPDDGAPTPTSKTGDASVSRLHQVLRAGGLPAPDAQPLVIAGHTVEHVWREHYAAALVGAVEDGIVQKLRDRGFEVVLFGDAERDWPDGLARLAAALGRVS
jgi:hypothetical protein